MTNLMKSTTRFDTTSLDDAKARFTEHFRRSLKTCLKRNFSVEVCFGQIWQETLETITLTEQEEAEVYSELLKWAKQWRK
jgi:hypothetical protein